MGAARSKPDSNAGNCLTLFSGINYDSALGAIDASLGSIPVGPVDRVDFRLLPIKVQLFIAKYAQLMRPIAIHICDGSQREANEIIGALVRNGTLTWLPKRENCFVCRTDPKDVARVKTWISTVDKYETVTHTPPDVEPMMGHWMSRDQLSKELDDRFPGCMTGRIMYVIPFSLGPIGGPMSKIGVQLTDSSYVVLNTRIITRVSSVIWDVLDEGDFVRCVHSVGVPHPIQRPVIRNWPCNPEKVFIAHRPATREIWSFGSGYGGNSILAKKCFALRIASCIARDEGWLAEHMLIMSVTTPAGKERFIAAALPSGCGKTNMAMLRPTVMSWRVHCIGDDVAWMRFRKDGQLVAINPENGFFGVGPGTNRKTNPMAMETLKWNSIITNCAVTDDGDFFWEGMEKEIPDKDMGMTNWLGERWKIGMPGKAAHASCRFTAPCAQCPIIHPQWNKPDGVPIDAIIFGARRPEGVPLVYETFNWNHGIFVGAGLKSEATSATDHTDKTVMHDPMAMRPFIGYNFGKYLQHWVDLGTPPNKVPKIFHVNWFRVGENKKYLWPGFGENIRVLDWICRRLDNEDIAEETPIGLIPMKGAMNLDGLGKINWDALFSLPKDYWVEDADEVRSFMDEQVGSDLPQAIRDEMDAQEKRIMEM